MSARSGANPDKISPRVVGGGVAGLIIAAVVRILIDRYANPQDADELWNTFQTLIVPALPAIGAWLGGLRAKRDVTPITSDAIPRDRAGNKLEPVSHTPSTGYLPTRLADPAQRPRRQPPPTDFP